ncbi:hypothetical protein B5M47_01035 [candidate division CPR3 bacterium 4484_211]|uniref:Bifunctional protein FolD n=1 Tax=candidate division CPR3 bacterium 4484_211 TaxID=1968527 RepID=A0A1W9NZJ6_UNCC3|nr:MAG: hypothetical protein B5M47_01035 [candidate division CPR3 bacterium 4484_211]
MSSVLDGRKIADKVLAEIKEEVAALPRPPGLAVVLIGRDPASRLYVKNKQKAAEQVGISCYVVRFPENVSIKRVKQEIAALNKASAIDGIILQLPFPSLSFPDAVPRPDPLCFLRLIDPAKDIDGLHPLNLGRLCSLKEAAPISISSDPNLPNLLVSPTAQAVMKLIRETGIDLAGKKAVVVSRSNLVGKPAALLLLLQDATVTVCHSKTLDLVRETSQADILVAAAGVPGLITKKHIKKGAIVIDVGINRVDDRLVGDVRFNEVKQKAGWITPVPGGVGPLTVAYLLGNVVRAFKLSRVAM